MLKKGRNGKWQEEGYSLKEGFDDILGVKTVQAFDKDGNQVGRAEFWDQDGSDDLYVGGVSVNEPHRRKGLASGMYYHAESVFGRKVSPSNMQTDGGKALWNQKDRKFGKSFKNFSNRLKNLAESPISNKSEVNNDSSRILQNRDTGNPKDTQKSCGEKRRRQSLAKMVQRLDRGREGRSDEGNRPSVLEKAHEYKGTWRPDASDEDGMPHPDVNKPYIKHTSSAGLPVWRHNNDMAKRNEQSFMQNYTNFVKTGKLSSNGRSLLNLLGRKIALDPDIHNVATGNPDGTQSMRLRHFSNALKGAPGYSISEENNSLVIKAPRHSGNRDNANEVHSWSFDGKDLKFLKDDLGKADVDEGYYPNLTVRKIDRDYDVPYKSYRLKNGMFHHVFAEPDFDDSYTHVLSSSQDPFDAESFLSKLTGNVGSDGGLYVDSSQAHEVGKGHGKMLYERVLGHHGSMISDTKLSPGSHKIYSEHFSGIPGVETDITDDPYRPHTAKLYDKDRYNQYIGDVEELDKGAAQRLFPYNPREEVSQFKDNLAWEWINGHISPEKRSAFPRIEGNARERLLHKLVGLTKVRVNKETGKREFLLHRGMSPEEYNRHSKEGHLDYTNLPHSKTSWTPKRDTAQYFGSSLVSAWVNEDDIHAAPFQTGLSRDGKHEPLSSRLKNEREIIVDHRSPLREEDYNEVFKLSMPFRDTSDGNTEIDVQADDGYWDKVDVSNVNTKINNRANLKKADDEDEKTGRFITKDALHPAYTDYNADLVDGMDEDLYDYDWRDAGITQDTWVHNHPRGHKVFSKPNISGVDALVDLWRGPESESDFRGGNESLVNKLGDHDFESFGSALREGAFQRLATRYFGLSEEQVPKTTVYTLNDRLHSAQKMAEEALPGFHFDADNLVDGSEIQKMALVDTILGNNDRHKGNFLVRNGLPFLIDHGFSFDYNKDQLGAQTSAPSYLRGMSDNISHPMAEESTMEWLYNLDEDEFSRHLDELGLPEDHKNIAKERLREAKILVPNTEKFEQALDALREIRYDKSIISKVKDLMRKRGRNI